MLKASVILILVSFYAGEAFSLSGCLVPSKAGSSRMLIDKSCECVATNSCVKRKPQKLSPSLYDGLDVNGKKLFSQVEKTKLNESYDVFNKIMELKSQGLAKSPEIKDLYIKLDKLNYDVRKSMLANHSSDFSALKLSYREEQNNRKKRNERTLHRLGMSLKNESITTQSKKLEKVSSSNSLKDPNVSEETKDFDQVSGSSNQQNGERSERSAEKVSQNSAETEAKKTILLNLNPKKLERNEDDSLFDIITKSYQRSAYPILLTP
jgi:hypothetical protein